MPIAMAAPSGLLAAPLATGAEHKALRTSTDIDNIEINYVHADPRAHSPCPVHSPHFSVSSTPSSFRPSHCGTIEPQPARLAPTQ